MERAPWKGLKVRSAILRDIIPLSYSCHDKPHAIPGDAFTDTAIRALIHLNPVPVIQHDGETCALAGGRLLIEAQTRLAPTTRIPVIDYTSCGQNVAEEARWVHAALASLLTSPHPDIQPTQIESLRAAIPQDLAERWIPRMRSARALSRLTGIRRSRLQVLKETEQSLPVQSETPLDRIRLRALGHE